MSNIKVLPLEYWMECEPFNDDPAMKGWGGDDDGYMLTKHPPTAPVFHRDGMYMHGKVAWFEVNGKAFTLDAKSFQHMLNTAHGSELSDEKFKALAGIIKVGLSTAKQRDMYYFACHARELVEIGRSTRKYMLDIVRDTD